jgi:peptidyl-tRNA hydrolase
VTIRPLTPADEPATGPPALALPLVVRLEKAAPPARTDALETAARAVLTFLTDPRAADGGEWAQPLRAWERRGIRKVVRRARGGPWQRACALPGLTVSGAGAEVRVHPPVPVDDWPPELRKLQVSGTELEDAVAPAAPEEGTPVLWLDPGLEMSAGKAMAQAGHGAQLAWWALDGAARAAWTAAGFALAVRVARDAAHFAGLIASGLPVVRDAGHTEVAPGSATVVADHPALPRR